MGKPVDIWRGSVDNLVHTVVGPSKGMAFFDSRDSFSHGKCGRVSTNGHMYLQTTHVPRLPVPQWLHGPVGYMLWMREGAGSFDPAPLKLYYTTVTASRMP